MSDTKRVQTFEVVGDEPVMGYVHGETFTVHDLEADREAELIGNRSIKFISGDEPRGTKKVAQKPSTDTPKGQR